MSVFDLRSLHLRPGEQVERDVEIEIEPFRLGGIDYTAPPPVTPAKLVVTRASSGLVLRLRFGVVISGPCQRCLEDGHAEISVDSTEYEDARADRADDELHTPYLADDRLDLSAWARDAIALELPEQILCQAACSGLCEQCGINRNEGACECAPPPPDLRLAKLAELRDRLER